MSIEPAATHPTPPQSPPPQSPRSPVPHPGAGADPTPLALTAALALLSFVVPLATDMYLPAFPRMADELHTDASGLQLTLTAFLFGLAAGQLVLGPLSDRCGRRRPILIGAAVCTVATALCAVAPSLWTLIALRFVMGFSGAAGVVVGRAVVSDLASGAAAARLFGVLMALGGIAPIVAPLVGGVVVAGAGWRAVFGILAGASLLTFLAALFAVPESLPVERRGGGGVRAVVRASAGVLRDRAYLGYAFAFAFGCGALFCYIAASPFLLQNVLGFGVRESSVAFAVGALTATLASVANVRLVARYDPRLLLRVGLLTMSATSACALLITLAGRLDRFWALGLVGVGFLGLGQVFATATALAIERVPQATGAGSAVLGTLQSVLGAVVAPLMGVAGRHTAVPLFLGMTVCSAAAVAALALTRGRAGVEA
ncbi:multidrug effflux MFS transporter [Embleya sp. NBC_00896]|uniref:multidrug effflux MFS transporter n=1 Tax=Embleya sp. NBC_00896 TaxID=2975961 RepID=UPI00386EA64E|nr:multidrug effflux MFS transporter [Embleya sp. NBC_00896]